MRRPLSAALFANPNDESEWQLVTHILRKEPPSFCISSQGSAYSMTLPLLSEHKDLIVFDDGLQSMCDGNERVVLQFAESALDPSISRILKPAGSPQINN
jgi:hypothetical protein